MVNVAIIGTGEKAYGICLLFRDNNNKKSSGNLLQVARPDRHMEETTFLDTGVPLTAFEDALARADILIITIPSKGLRPFLSDNLKLLRGKIVVDATERFSLHEDLTQEHVFLVKGLHDLDETDIMLHNPLDKSKLTSAMCAKSPKAMAIVKSFAEKSLGLSVKMVPFHNFVEMSQRQASMGDEWISSVWMMSIVFAFAQLYTCLRLVSDRIAVLETTSTLPYPHPYLQH